ncbi:MAG: Asp-tRNA(Asn)/Glu-tRNA(Gln) amidotransferase subunit GatA [Synergistaceae bacterium]|jgi:aspartyl-tRNA(Asn)/glutamyl-tRNA(Gln) amidotransferase subunit A
MSSVNFINLTAKEITDGIINKKWTAKEILSSFIGHIKKHDMFLNSIITLSEEQAIADATRVDAVIARGENPGLLAGVPFLVKDNICTEGIKTTCGSKMLQNWVPLYDSTAVKNMREAGAVLLGKTNMDEFAMGDTTETSFFGRTKNPRNISFIAGGSSGGSAAAVAAGFCPIALGTDTGGSIRQPSAFCGVHGMKPSYGQVSRYGVVGYASSLDQVGPITRSIEDMATVMDVLAKADTNDSTCDAFDRQSFSLLGKGKQELKGKKIAILSGYDKKLVDKQLLEAIDQTVKICIEEGADVFEVELPIALKYAVACYNIVAFSDASSKLACYDGMRYGYHEDGKNLSEMYKKSRSSGFGEEVRHRIIIGTAFLTQGYYEEYYIPATKVRQLIVEEFMNLYQKADVLISPVSPTLPNREGIIEELDAQSYLKTFFTCIANLAGIPALSLNVGFTPEGVPTNVQLCCPRYEDGTLLSIATIIEKNIGSPYVAELISDEGVN